MGFLDEADITVVSGDGGNGCVSFRKEKYIPKGGPDGGDGGKGGDILFHATKKRHSLIEFSSRKYLKARNGQPGKGKNQTGKSGADLIIDVPLGTLVQDPDTGEVLLDLTHDNQEILFIPGGKGGKGNQHFATSTNRAPRTAQPGFPGEEKKVRLSLRFLADIGLVGLPNSGKSTLLSRLSMARPKVDNYPFTTIVPNLGVLETDDESTVIVADIPGLIEGAAQGRGLGHHFLKHIERTRLLLHLLDITYKPRQDILEDFNIIMEEIKAYDPTLASKRQMVLINKMDLYKPGHRNLGHLQKALKERGVESLVISALTGEGIGALKQALTVFVKSTLSRDM